MKKTQHPADGLLKRSALRPSLEPAEEQKRKEAFRELLTEVTEPDPEDRLGTRVHQA